MENKNLVMDYYQLTMSYSHFKNNRHNEIGYYDMFFRKTPDNGGYVIFNGLDKVIDYVKNFKFTLSDIEFLRAKGDFDEEFLTYLKNFEFKGDIYSVKDGTVVFPNEPLITVKGNIIEAQLLETKLLLLVNYPSLVSTKTSRIVASAEGRGIMEFGTRRAQGETAAIEGAKYAYIAGAIGTSNVQTEKEYGVKSLGTMAHSYIESFDTEYDAFLAYAKTFPNNATLLVDTYDTLNSGVINAIRVAKDYLEPNGYRLKGIRLDSGDLAYLSKEARKKLDAYGMEDTKIIASNSLDEYLIKDLITQGAKIDIFGVGENLITSKSSPVLGGVYKLVALEKENTIVPKIKFSDNIGKITNPGYKKLYRFYDKDTNYALGDVIALHDEKINKDTYTLFSPNQDFIKKTIFNYYVKELQVPVFINKELVYEVPSIEETRNYCKEQLDTIYPEIKRFNNPHTYYVDLSKDLLKLKREMLNQKENLKESVKYVKQLEKQL
jgi:nicotinate phosphoribosyltransferase